MAYLKFGRKKAKRARSSFKLKRSPLKIDPVTVGLTVAGEAFGEYTNFKKQQEEEKMMAGQLRTNAFNFNPIGRGR